MRTPEWAPETAGLNGSGVPAPKPPDAVSPMPLEINLESHVDDQPPYDVKDDADATIRGLVEAHEPRRIRWSMDHCASDAHPHRGDEVIAQLAASKLRVVELSIRECGVTDTGVKALVSSSFAPDLVRLDLGYGLISHRGAELIAHTPLAQLETLDLTANSVGPVGAAALASGEAFLALKTLALGDAIVRADGAEALARSSAFPELKGLFLSGDYVGDAGAHAVASMHQRLTDLDLAYNEIGDDGALALLHAEALSDTKVSLAFNVVGAATAGILKAREVRSGATRRGGFFVDDQYKLDLSRLPKPIRPPRATDPALPESVELRHMHFFGQETGFDYPIFMHPGPPYGNGGARDFYWDDKAKLHVGAFANNAGQMGSQTRETRTKQRVTMKRTVYGVWTEVAEFSFDPAYEPYFRPIANEVLASLRHEKAE